MTTNNTKKTLSASEKIRRIYVRAKCEASRETWYLSDLARWTKLTTENVKNLILWLRGHNQIDCSFRGQSVNFNF